jgi:hypothetical protein
MLARWKEGAVLLFARGLGTNAEMDASAVEECTFKAWCSSQSAASSTAQGPPVATGDAAVCAPPGLDEDVGRGATAVASDNVEVDDGMIGGVRVDELDAAFRSALGTALK